MLINVLEPEECRIAILENGTLEELYIERASAAQLVGNVYKARVINVEPSLEAAFVDFGGGRNGFLHASDVVPSYYPDQRVAKREKGRGRERAPITSVFKRGQELMVQVTKEGIDRKAPKVTTYISIPGRYLVVMPYVHRRGVSRKIGDEATRRELSEMLKSLKPPEDLGFIIRTAGHKQTRREFRKDLTYLTRLWAAIEARYKKEEAPSLLYQESDLVIRAVRDIYTTDISEMLVDSEEEYDKVIEFMKMTMPRQRSHVKLYREAEPLFHKYKVEEEIERIHKRRVPLPGGGSIVLEQAEALVAIDVNSGKNTRELNAEQTAYKTNMEAATEIARQIRLRDLGGVIVGDFIDMRDAAHNQEVERALWAAMKKDRARSKMLRMSRFGLIEMTRQRMRPSLRSAAFGNCPVCGGTGQVKTLESMGLDVLRSIKARLKIDNVGLLDVRVSKAVADYMLNEKRRDLIRLEESAGVRISVLGERDAGAESIEIQCYARDGKKIRG